MSNVVLGKGPAKDLGNSSSAVAEAVMAETHQVENQAGPLPDYNAYLDDRALVDAVKREGGEWGHEQLVRMGELCGSVDYNKLGYLANANGPELRTHDAFGARVDEVEFHPAYHELFSVAKKEGLHSLPWTNPKPGAHVVRTAMGYMQSIVDAGHGCPLTMTHAGIATLRMQPDLAEKWEPLITNNIYDARNIPAHEKKGLTMGMAMTEKQGGSDVRLNTTKAIPVAAGGPGQEYELVGHKYFVSGPMGDVFLMLANAPGGLSCFLVPRWRADSTKNQFQLQQLKKKMGNVSNATAESELRGALGWLIGEEGKGIKTILEAVGYTRFDCILGSVANMRSVVQQILHFTSKRIAFGKPLIEQPLMENVLADLVIESEASMAMMMRLARSLDMASVDESEKHFKRMGTAVGKYWVCKRTPAHAYEAMECIGGSATMETSIMPRLYREAPINAIWEGCGNVQALDVLRAMAKDPASLDVFLQETLKAKGADSHFDKYLVGLQKEFTNFENMEYRARVIVQKMAVAMQASILIQSDNQVVAEAFCASRLGEEGHLMYGTLPTGLNTKAIVEQARFVS